MNTRSLFITGTDTGVGKTIVTALLALRLQQCGVDVGVMKPFATGCTVQNGEYVNEDALWLKQITGVNDELELINPVRFEEPLAPLVAARRVGAATHDWLARSLDAQKVLLSRHEIVLVEGVGGLLVPLQEDAAKSTFVTCVDLANVLQSPVIVVARRTLGTINHTALTCGTALQPPAHFAALVFCDAQPVEENDVAAQTSPEVIAEMTHLPIWARVPHLRDLSRETLQSAAQKYFSASLCEPRDKDV